MLLKPAADLAGTDICSHAVEQLRWVSAARRHCRLLRCGSGMHAKLKSMLCMPPPAMQRCGAAPRALPACLAPCWAHAAACVGGRDFSA